MPLQEKLQAMKKETAATKPPELVSIMLEETRKLVDSGLAAKAVQIGETLPGFVLPDENGNLVRSANLLTKGPLVVSFYRGLW